MHGLVSTLARSITFMGVCTATVMAVEVDSMSNDIFDLYFFGNDETGMFGTPTGNEWMDSPRQTSGHVKDSSVYYWNAEMKQAMLNAVNTWTNAISTPYDTEKHARKLRIGFFLDDASTVGGLMSISMAGYSSTQTVVTEFEPQYGTKANIYSVAEWAWRENNVTSGYMPDSIMEGAYWESEILTSGANNIDMAIVLNPIVTSYGFDANGYYYRNEIARSAQEMQNIATHEIAHGMGMDTYLYTQSYDAFGNSVAKLSGYVSTWDSLVTLDGEHIVTVEDGEISARYATLKELHEAGWECAEGKDPYDAGSYTGEEIQYDPDRKLSLEGELGVHIAAVMLEGDTMVHLSYEDGTNVLGPGGTANASFSESDLRALELMGWSINREMKSGTAVVPEPSTGALILLGLVGAAFRRRRQ